ncbi:hypothetical protein, partial [Rhodanobacter sp. 115]|uniref:hypothetical protein n=1 Tax=Rhodanobacter sp. FW021-MT20 TaxID=1162282 RepID=UPI001ED94FFC
LESPPQASQFATAPVRANTPTDKPMCDHANPKKTRQSHDQQVFKHIKKTTQPRTLSAAS